MEDEQRLAIMEAVAQGVIQGLNGNENRLFGNGAIRPDSFPSQNYPDWSQWKTHFYRVGRANGWTELQGLQAVPVCLIGYALDEYNAAPRELREQVDGEDAPTLAALFNHLGREMGMMRNDRLGKAEFRKLRQQPEETLREFARRVRNIGKIAYSEKDPNTRDELFREKFLEGLSDVQLEVQLLKENPQTIGDLVNRAVDLEVIARTTRGRSPNEQERYEEFGRQQDSSCEFRGYSPEPWKEGIHQLTRRMDQMTQMMMTFMETLSTTVRPEKQAGMTDPPKREATLVATEQKFKGNGGFVADICPVCDGFGHFPQQCPKRQVMVEDAPEVHGKLTREKAAQIVERAGLAIERKALNAVRVVDCSGYNSGVFVKARIEGREMDILLDTGAGVNVVDSSTMESLRPPDEVKEFRGELRSVDGQPVTTKGLTRLNLQLGPMKEQEEFVVVPHCEPTVILGLNFVKKHRMIFDFGKNELSIPPLSSEPLKMRVVASQWGEDGNCYQRSTSDSRESAVTELSRPTSSTQHLSVPESKNPRWDSGEKPPPRRWDAKIVDTDADFRMVSTTESQNRSDGSGCSIVTTLKPHQVTLFGDDDVDGGRGNLKYKEIEGDLFSSKGCLAHCVSADFHMGVGVAKQVKTRYPTTYPKDVNHKRQPVFAQWIEGERRYVYHLVTKQRYFEKPTYESVKTSLQQMRTHAEWSGVHRISLPKIGCGLDQLNWSEIKSLIKEVFKGSHIVLTVYVAPGQTQWQTRTCDNETRVKCRREEQHSWPLGVSDKADEAEGSGEQSTRRNRQIRTVRAPPYERGEDGDRWPVKRGTVQPSAMESSTTERTKNMETSMASEG